MYNRGKIEYVYMQVCIHDIFLHCMKHSITILYANTILSVTTFLYPNTIFCYGREILTLDSREYNRVQATELKFQRRVVRKPYEPKLVGLK